MRICEILLLLLSAGVCLYASATDLKKGIISNKVILYAFPLIACINAIYYGVFCKDLLVEFSLNVLILCVLGVLLYAVHVWAGGDSKLLILVAFAMPARLYHYYSHEMFPTLSIVIFTFSVGYVYLMIHSLLCAVRKEKAYSDGNKKQTIVSFLKDYIYSSLYLTFFAQLFSRFLSTFYLENQPLFLFINIFLVFLLFNFQVFRSKWLLLVCAAADLALILSSSHAYTHLPLWGYAVVALLFLSRQLISRYNYLEISAEELKPGMIPAAASVALMLPSGMADLPSRLSEDLNCRLTEKQIAAIRKWFSKQKDVKEITIVRKIPFAIFITLGYFLFALMGILR